MLEQKSDYRPKSDTCESAASTENIISDTAFLCLV